MTLKIVQMNKKNSSNELKNCSNEQKTVQMNIKNASNEQKKILMKYSKNIKIYKWSEKFSNEQKNSSNEHKKKCF